MTQTKRIATSVRPGLDALVATWLAQRYLCPGERTEVVFFPKGHPTYREEGIAWCAEPCGVSALKFGWGAERQSFAQRYAESATGHLWTALLDQGKPVNHLIDLVDAVHSGVVGKPSDGAPWRKIASLLQTFWQEAKSSASSDIALCETLSGWLDRHDKHLRRYSSTPEDWEQIGARLPEGPGTYALLLACRASRAFLVGRTGNLGRMVTQRGYYVYLGSALGGLRGRDRHHLTPVEQLRAKWQVDGLRLVSSLEEIWYTASDYPWECPWAGCMMALPGARIPKPKKFGATRCEGRCVTHLPYFREKPSLKAFRSKVSKLRPSECHVERLAVATAD